MLTGKTWFYRRTEELVEHALQGRLRRRMPDTQCPTLVHRLHEDEVVKVLREVVAVAF
jgi:hypothetical protein